jgi:hypothetical protein
LKKKEKKEREKGGPHEDYKQLAGPISHAVKVLEGWDLNQSIAMDLIYIVVSSEFKFDLRR